MTLEEELRAGRDRMNRLIEAAFPDPAVDDSRARMRYAMTSGGKRLRPILCAMAYRAKGGKGDGADPLALLWEVLHTFSLVHDDLPIMDDDPFRRGKPTLHVLYGEKVAVLTGIELLCRAFELFLEWVEEADVPHDRATALLEILTEAAGFQGMVGGQMMDLCWEGRAGPGTPVETIHSLKTARMLEGAVASGAVEAGASGPEWNALREYGRRLGLAYQIADDLLDRRSDFRAMGKTTGRDEELKKATFPAVRGEAESERRLGEELARAREALDRAGISGSRLADVLELVRERGNRGKEGGIR